MAEAGRPVLPTLWGAAEEAMSGQTKPKESIMKFIWCMLFHRRFQEKTGERYVLKVSISYFVRCSRCGIEHLKKNWLLGDW